MFLLHGYKVAALCISRIHEEVMRDFIDAFNRILCDNGWRVLVLATNMDLYYKTISNRGEEIIFNMLETIDIDAVVVCKDKILDDDCFHRICQTASDRSVPTYIINGEYEKYPNLIFNHKLGFEKVVRHLIEFHSIRDFVFIAGIKGNPYSDAREEIMKSVLREYKIPFNDSDIYYGDFWSKPTEKIINKLIKENRIPKAIVCANDIMALTVNSVLRNHGYSVPNDVIVTGFDGIDDALFSSPGITSCKCNYDKLGEAAAHLVISEDTRPVTHMVTPRLIRLESCGCKPDFSRHTAKRMTEVHDLLYRFQAEENTLNEIAAEIQSCNSLNEAAEKLYDQIFYSMTCMLTEEAIDPSVDPSVRRWGASFGKNVFVLSDAHAQDSPHNLKLFPVNDIMPRLKYAFDTKKTIILIALHQLEMPLGYLAFWYDEPLLSNFMKVGQTAVFLSNALCNFRNIQYQKYLQESYRFDQLTGLLLRGAFLRQFNNRRSAHPDKPLTLILCDLDGLKHINDHYSHHEGDNAIKKVAEALHSVCSNGICCRYGGDEIVAVLFDLPDYSEITNSISKYLDNYNENSQKPYKVATSIGIYTGCEDFDAMFERADEIMYKNKIERKAQRTD